MVKTKKVLLVNVTRKYLKIKFTSLLIDINSKCKNGRSPKNSNKKIVTIFLLVVKKKINMHPILVL